MKYEVIFFDADETLFDFKLSEREAFKNAMLEFNVCYDENYHLPIYQEINTAIWKEFEEGKITQAKLKIERFQRLAEKLEMDFDATKFASSYMKHLANGSFLYEGAPQLLELLSPHCTLSIITNGLTAVQDKRIRKSAVAHHFKDIVISEEILISKPDAKIFEHAMKNLNYVDKSKVLMVGDSLSSDIQGGINYGIDTCWYNPNHLPNKTNIVPTYEVASFEELKNLILK